MCGCGVEDAPRWVGTSGLHGTEWQTLGRLELLCNEAVQYRGTGPGMHISRLYISRIEWYAGALLIYSNL